jgi:hypothetical protein
MFTPAKVQSFPVTVSEPLHELGFSQEERALLAHKSLCMMTLIGGWHAES